MLLNPYIPYFVADLGEIRCTWLLRNTVVFLEIRRYESYTLLRVLNEIFLYFIRFSRAFGKIRHRRCLQKIIAWLWVLQNSAHWQPLYLDVKLISIRIFSHLLADLGEIPWKRSARNAVQHLWVSWKPALERPYLWAYVKLHLLV
jgi:hypothetical protein